MCRIVNEKIKKGQNVSISGNHGNQSYNTLTNMGKCHISVCYLLIAKLGFKVSVLGRYTNISHHN